MAAPAPATEMTSVPVPTGPAPAATPAAPASNAVSLNDLSEDEKDLPHMILMMRLLNMGVASFMIVHAVSML
jgi:hypothetical protein